MFKPFYQIKFSSNLSDKEYFIKKCKLINDYKLTDYEYEVKLGHVKDLCTMHICKYLSQSYHCHT